MGKTHKNLAMKHFSIRENQIIAPFGPGSIFEFRSQSFIIKTIDHWQANNGKNFDEPRLRKLLGVKYFKKPLLSEKPSDSLIKIFRFPQAHFCSNSYCNLLQDVTELLEPDVLPRCKKCNSKLVPMRFIMCCSNGHIQDVPWYLWVHRNKPECKEKKNLEFFSEGKSGGLDSLYVKCLSCNTRRSLKGITSVTTMERLKWKCSGKHPYENKVENCEMIPHILQKGASNIHFPVIKTSIDIPQKSSTILVDTEYNYLRYQNDDFKALLDAVEFDSGDITRITSHPFYISKIRRIESQESISFEKIISILIAHYQNKTPEVKPTPSLNYDETQFRYEEYSTFTDPEPIQNYPNLVIEACNPEFTAFKTNVTDKKFETIMEICWPVFKKVLKIEKLRIIKVFQSFFRLDSPGSFYGVEDNNIRFSDYLGNKHAAREVKPHGNRQSDWLPGTENFGEGIFLEFNTDHLKNFINNYYQKRSKSINTDPYYIFIHSFSHVLIRQMAYECGYPAASIQERIYFSSESATKMCGLLLYTAAGDSLGSLGGLSSLVEPDKFFSLIYNGIKATEWCSYDPLCIESGPQGLNNANLAACHSCLLLPETSCDKLNMSLDRAILIGTQDNQFKGIFSDLLNKVG